MPKFSSDPNSEEIVRQKLMLRYGTPPANFESMVAAVKHHQVESGQSLDQATEVLIEHWDAHPKDVPK